MEFESSLHCKIFGSNSLQIVLKRVQHVFGNTEEFTETKYRILPIQLQHLTDPTSNINSSALFFTIQHQQRNENENIKTQFMYSKSGIDLNKARLSDTRNISIAHVDPNINVDMVKAFFLSCDLNLVEQSTLKCISAKHYSGIEIVISTSDDEEHTVVLKIIYDNSTFTSLKERELVEFCNSFKE